MNDIFERLNVSQRQVVSTTEGPVLVIAGAGSGKTRVIEYRVLHLVLSRVNPSSILLLTFTRRAAQEMLSRAAHHDIRCRQVEGGTFHSFAYQVLKKYGALIGLQSFTILDEDDSVQAVHLAAAKLNLFEDQKRCPKKDTLRKVISMATNKELSVKQVLEREYPNFIEYAREIERIKDEYSRLKSEKGYVDYDDLLVYLKVLLEQKEEVRSALAKRYRYIMVDEYQDTNRLQAGITYLLGKDHSNVMVVGDDAQSIYGFRGATHRNIMEFPKLFPGTRVVKLEANYRSRQPILDVANQILKNMKQKYDKSLVSADKKNGEKPQLLFFRDGYEEADWIAQQIQDMRGQGVGLSHQAVLFRSAYISIPLQVALRRSNIPFQVYGGLKFYETSHVKDVISCLRILCNQKDEISWARVLLLIEGVGPKTAQKIIAASAGNTFAARIANFLSRERHPPKYARHLQDLAGMLDELANGSEPVSRQFARVCTFYRPYLKEKFDDWQQRANDLEALTAMAQRYTDLADFLADFTIDAPERSLAQAAFAGEDEKPLVLSTIHSAKGLEWDTVFIIGMADGILPVSFSLYDEEGLEEEQRLFYVAVTRAKKHLFLTVHHEGTGMGLTQFNKISRFLDSPELLATLEYSSNAEEPDYDF